MQYYFGHPTTASATYQTTDTRFATGRSGHIKP